MAKHLHNDSIEELLRQYLLEQDGLVGPEGSELGQMAGQVFDQPPVVEPSPEQGAEMLSRLKEAFPAGSPGGQAPPPEAPGPPPGPSGFFSGLKLPVLLGTAAAVVVAVTLLLTNPFASSNADLGGGNTPGEQPGLVHGNYASGNDPDSDGNSSDEEVRATVLDPGTNITSLSEADLEETFGPNAENIGPVVKEPEDKNPGGLFPADPGDEPDPSDLALNVPAPEDLPDPLAELFAKTVVPPQPFVYKGDEGTLIRGGLGTLLEIPPKAFRLPNGSIATGEVKIELREVYQKSDYILSNLPTEYKDKELVSGGVISVEAFQGGKPLSLIKGKEMYVEFPLSRENQDNMQLWAGSHEISGELVWRPVGGRLDKSLIPLPIMEINFQQFTTKGGSNREWNDAMKKLNWPRYDNTFIGTREFVERLLVARRMGFVTDIVKLYAENLDKDLWEVDMMVAEMMQGDYRNWEHKQTGKTFAKEDFSRFAEEKLTRVNPFSNYGVNLELSSSWGTLARKVGEEEADRTLRLHRLRKEILPEVNAISGSGKKYKGNFASTSWKRKRTRGFSLRQLGWTNLDQVVKPSQKNHSLVAKIEGDIDLQSTRTFFVYNYRNSVIVAKENDAKSVKFKRIPANSSGYLVTIGYKDGKPYWSETLLGMESDTEISIKPQPVGEKELLAKASKMNLAGRRY